MADAGAGPALSVSELSKSFLGTRALRDVSFDVATGEIHALVGGNGSGKSTLIKILGGVYQGGGGTLTVRTSMIDASRATPAWARAAGLRFVHQDPTDFPELSVAENLAIGAGYETTWAGTIAWGRLRRRSRALLARFGIDAPPETPVRTLRTADRALLAVARALQDAGTGRGLLFVLDEPTASLPEENARTVWAALRQCADDGHTVLFVSHRLEEISANADTATVLRDGQVVATLRRDEITEAQLVEAIVGRALVRGARPIGVPEAERRRDVVLEVKELEGGAVRGVSFALHDGEILGIAGPLGAGRSQLLRLLFGVERVRRGHRHPRRCRSALLPHRRRDACRYRVRARGSRRCRLPRAVARRKPVGGGGRFVLEAPPAAPGARAPGRTRVSMEAFSIDASSERQEMATLSGGNQQKVVVARWLRRNPKVLLLDEPTHGVDVRARHDLYGFIADTAAAGCAAIVVSDEFDELARICDRVLVMVHGRVVAELSQPDITPRRLTEIAFGASTDASTGA